MDLYSPIALGVLALLVVAIQAAYRLDFSWKALGDWLLLHVFVEVSSGYSTPSLTAPPSTPSSTKQKKWDTPTVSKQRYPLYAYENVQFWWTIVLLSTLPLVYWGFWVSFIWIMAYGVAMTYYELFIGAPKQLKAYNADRMVKLEAAVEAERILKIEQFEAELRQALRTEAHGNIQEGLDRYSAVLAELKRRYEFEPPDVSQYKWRRIRPNYSVEFARTWIEKNKPPQMALKPLYSPLEPVELEAIMQRSRDHLAHKTADLTSCWQGDKIPYEDRR